LLLLLLLLMWLLRLCETTHVELVGSC